MNYKLLVLKISMRKLSAVQVLVIVVIVVIVVRRCDSSIQISELAADISDPLVRG